LFDELVPRFKPVDENWATCVPSDDTSTKPLPGLNRPVFNSLALRAGFVTDADVPK